MSDKPCTFRYLFLREEANRTTTYALLEIQSEFDDAEKTFERFRDAIGHWITHSPVGRAAWSETVEDFNIGDYALYSDDPDLQAALQAFQLEARMVEIRDLVEHAKNFDLILPQIDTDSLPDIVVRINDRGLAAIRDFLEKNHVFAERHGKDYFTEDMIHAWAMEAEKHAEEGHGCFIELGENDSVHGRTQTFDVPEDGYDIQLQTRDD